MNRFKTITITGSLSMISKSMQYHLNTEDMELQSVHFLNHSQGIMVFQGKEETPIQELAKAVAEGG